MRQEERRARTRGALLRAAGSAFAESGYDGASLDAIAASADLSKGAVYAHFETKLDLYLAVVSMVLEEATGRLDSVSQALRASESADAAAGHYFTRAGDAEHIAHVTDLWQMAMREPAIGRELHGFREHRLVKLAGAAVDAGMPPARALETANMVAKLIDADTLYGRLGEVSANRSA